MSQALYRKWRSQTFDQVVGQETVTQTLRNALQSDRVAHAYLFSGPRGTGKTSVARILAKALSCSAPVAERPCNRCPTCVAINEGRMIDLVEIDAASNNGVDDVRDLREKVGFRPSEGRYKVYIVDEVHMLSSSAFNALLKTLEEPPPHARFILATTEPHKIPATVLSRCQRFDFRRISVPEIVDHLAHIAAAEGIQIDTDALVTIGRSAQGCMRDAISLLDQMLSYSVERITLEQVQQLLGTAAEASLLALLDAIASRDVPAGLKLIQQLVLEGASLGEFAQQCVETLRDLLVLQMTGDPSLLTDLSSDSVEQLRQLAENLDQSRTFYAIRRLSEAIAAFKQSEQPRLLLEMALIEMVQGPAAEPPTVTPSAVGAPAADHGTGAHQAVTPTPRRSPSAATAPPTEATAPSSPDAAPPLDAAALTRLRGRWNDFLNAIRIRCGLKTQAALRSVRDITISQQVVVFAFGENKFTQELIEKLEVRSQVEAVLVEFLGRPIRLECQRGLRAELSGLTENTVGTLEPGSGPDDLVAYAVSDLGAEVVEQDLPHNLAANR